MTYGGLACVSPHIYTPVMQEAVVPTDSGVLNSVQ